MAVTLATAFVEILPKMDRIGPDIERRLARQDPKVTVEAEADTGKMSRELDREAKKAGSRFGALFSGGLGGGLAKLAGPAAAVGAGLGAAAVGILNVTNAAGDLSETISKTNVIFGKGAPEIMKWGDTAARALGLSKNEALSAASSFGDMFLQIGFSTKAATGMSTGMVQLASDLASFHNADITEVIEAQSAAFRGEYDSLQRYIPTINAAAVEQEALRQTGKKTAKELTLQDKALATNALMFKTTKAAQGDFARTSGGLANQQRILRAQFEDTRAKLGKFFIPVVLSIVKFFNNDLSPAMDKVREGLGGIGDLLFKGDYTGSLSKIFVWEEDSPTIGALFMVRST